MLSQARLKTRNFELDVATFKSLEAERRQLQTRTEEMQARRNALSKQIGILKSKKEDTSAVMAEVSSIGNELRANETALSGLHGPFVRIHAIHPEPATRIRSSRSGRVRQRGNPPCRHTAYLRFRNP